MEPGPVIHIAWTSIALTLITSSNKSNEGTGSSQAESITAPPMTPHPPPSSAPTSTSKPHLSHLLPPLPLATPLPPTPTSPHLSYHPPPHPPTPTSSTRPHLSHHPPPLPPTPTSPTRPHLSHLPSDPHLSYCADMPRIEREC